MSAARAHSSQRLWLAFCPRRAAKHLSHGLVARATLIHIGHRDLLLRELALALVGLGLLVLALKDGLAVLVKLQLGDDALRGVDADLHGRAARLLAGDALDVDDPLLAVALDD